MKKISNILSLVKSNLKIVAVGAIALVIGGFSPVLVRAAIPSTADGQINACYRTSTGALRVADTEAGETCNTAFETSLSWPSQQSTSNGATQSAYVFVNADGSWDTANSKNTIGVNPVFQSTHPNGYDLYNYCMDLTFEPKWAISNSLSLVRGASMDAAAIDSACGTQYEALIRDVRIQAGVNSAYRYAFFD